MNTHRVRTLALASSFALLFGLGLRPPVAEADSCAGINTLPATGQITPAMGTKTLDPDSPVLDDGTVQAGGALSFHDNGDGTITDQNTGLMWEQKIFDGGLHDAAATFRWSALVISETI